jgi:small subunit ribosomal protein S6
MILRRDEAVTGQSEMLKAEENRSERRERRERPAESESADGSDNADVDGDDSAE